tara:strand:- start:381 stop:572 length:192 start_codon:yes stop_codon:yes gene_type:complete
LGRPTLRGRPRSRPRGEAAFLLGEAFLGRPTLRGRPGDFLADFLAGLPTLRGRPGDFFAGIFI